jgi:hypothetical protein
MPGQYAASKRCQAVSSPSRRRRINVALVFGKRSLIVALRSRRMRRVIRERSRGQENYSRL